MTDFTRSLKPKAGGIMYGFQGVIRTNDAGRGGTRTIRHLFGNTDHQHVIKYLQGVAGQPLEERPRFTAAVTGEFDASPIR